MKTKSLIIGLCALAFAIGSAFATLSIPDYEIHILRLTASGPQWECMPINGICDGTSFACKATVNGIPTNVYELDTECIIRVINATTHSVASINDETIIGQDPYNP